MSARESSYFQCEEYDDPFTRIPNELIRDESISPNCRWLIIYLLSNKPGWEIHLSQIQNHLKPHMGRDKVYSIVKEAMEAGYISRVRKKEGNLIRYRYLVSRSPKFKKCFPCPGFQDTGFPNAEKTDTLRTTISSSYEEERTTIKKETSSPTSEQEPKEPPPKEASSSKQAEELSHFFLSKIREENPAFKQPNLLKWSKTFDKLLRIDKRDSLEVMQIISWVREDDFWKANCLSPESLRKNYDKLVEKRRLQQIKNRARNNREWAKLMKLKCPEELRHMTFDAKYVYNTSRGAEVLLDLPSETFKEAFAEIFGGSSA